MLYCPFSGSYSMPETVLSALDEQPHSFPPTNLRVVKRIAQCHTAVKWWGWDSNPSLTPKPMLTFVGYTFHGHYFLQFKKNLSGVRQVLGESIH